MKILAFGQIAEIMGTSEMNISDINTLEELNSRLYELFPILSSTNYALAVNQTIIQTNVELKNEDIVALLPPFSGG